MKYLLKNSPVQRNQSTVTKYLLRILGQQETAIERDLVRNGGIVRDNLSKTEAGKLAKELRQVGAIVELVKVKKAFSEKEYQLSLLGAGIKKIVVL